MSVVEFDQATYIVMIFMGIQAILGKYLEHKHVNWVHEDSVAIGLGVLLALIKNFAKSNSNPLSDSVTNVIFSSLLPIIIFKEGYSLNKRHFFKNFFYVILYGIFGSLLFFLYLILFNWIFQFIPGFIIYNTTESSNGIVDPSEYGMQNLLYFAACITSKDSSVVLSFLKFDHHPKLYSILLGEQILNDLMVFSLQRSVSNLISDKMSQMSIGIFLWKLFITILEQLFVSTIVGLTIGLISTWITKQFRFLSNHHAICNAITIYSGYITYTICEAYGYSGVIAVLLDGAIMSHYLLYNLSKKSAESSKVTINALAYISETFIYFYLGYSLVSNPIPAGVNNWEWIILAQFFIIIPISRFMAMITSHLLAVITRMKTKNSWRVNRYDFSIILVSGLIRGPVAYALITESAKGTTLDIAQSGIIYIVASSTIFIAGGIKYYCDWAFLQIANDPKYHPNHPSVKESVAAYKSSKSSIMDDIEAYNQFKSKSQTFFRRIDENWLKPLLIFDYLNRKEDIKLSKRKLYLKEKNMLKDEDRFMDDSVRYERLAAQNAQLQQSKASSIESKRVNSIDSQAQFLYDELLEQKTNIEEMQDDNKNQNIQIHSQNIQFEFPYVHQLSLEQTDGKEN